MKDMAATASEARSFSKLLRIIVAGALVLTFFNTTLMAYADGDGDGGDANTSVNIAENEGDSTDGTENDAATVPEPKPENIAGTGSADLKDEFYNELQNEFDSLFHAKDNSNDPGTYGIHLDFNLNGGNDSSDFADQYFKYDYGVFYDNNTENGTPDESWGNYLPDHVEEVTYKDQSNKVTSGNTTYVNKGGAVEFIIPKADPTRDGYKFEGWSTNASSTTGEYKAGDSFFAWFCSVLYAIWSPDGVQPSQPEEDEPTPVVPGVITPDNPGTPGGTTPTGGTPAAGGTGGTPVAPVQMTSLGDNGNPLGVFDAGHGIYCWVHWWILLGMLITCAASVLVLNRRERHISKLNKIENDILENRTAVPSNAGSVYVPVGAQA